jgi:hypothetical protein
MYNTQRFKRGSGCFTCGSCGRKTRDTGDNGNCGLCPECYELAGLENQVSDDGLTRESDPKIFARMDALQKIIEARKPAA